MLLTLVDEQQAERNEAAQRHVALRRAYEQAIDERDERRQQVADALRERDALVARNAVLQRQVTDVQALYAGLQRGYDEANRERVEALKASDAWRSDYEALKAKLDASTHA